MFRRSPVVLARILRSSPFSTILSTPPSPNYRDKPLAKWADDLIKILSSMEPPRLNGEMPNRKALKRLVADDACLGAFDRPLDEAGGKLFDVLFAFKNGDKPEHAFAPTTSAFERRRIHEIAETLGLSHNSVGIGPDRHLVVGRTQATKLDEFLEARDIISMTGSVVNRIGRQYSLSPSVPRYAVANRQNHNKRDALMFHLTLANADELFDLLRQRPVDARTQYKQAVNALLTELVERHGVVNDWVPVGLGAVLQTGVDGAAKEAFFVIVDWPSGQKARAALGLRPHDFHITVGFQPEDLHAVSKGRETLVKDAFVPKSPTDPGAAQPVAL